MTAASRLALWRLKSVFAHCARVSAVVLLLFALTGLNSTVSIIGLLSASVVILLLVSVTIIAPMSTPIRKKRKFELARPAAMTKLAPQRIHTLRVRGGNKKYRALRLDQGNFSWPSEGISRKT